ncbi:MAG: NAD-dependent epimerase/dehydratase family protein [Pyrinomonadaceae bacterium]
MTKTILITGGAGFVGSALAIRLKKDYPSYRIIALDNLKRRGSELNLTRLKQSNVEYVHGDIRNLEDFGGVPLIDIIVEASAEPSVLAGVREPPDYVVNTNLIGTINCLNFAVKNKSDFLFLSTSRVYPIANLENIRFKETETRFVISPDQILEGVSENGIGEDFPLAGCRSIYGATKLCSELLIAEYNQFYGLKTIVNRCGVLTGAWQMGKANQGVVVLWMARHFWRQKLGYFGYGGTGKQVRDILHVNDLYRLINYQIHNIDRLNNQTFNVGGGNQASISLCELTDLCREISGNEIPTESVAENRQADIRIYITDNSKVTKLTNWSPEITVSEILEDIYIWLKDNEDSLRHILK